MLKRVILFIAMLGFVWACTPDITNINTVIFGDTTKVVQPDTTKVDSTKVDTTTHTVPVSSITISPTSIALSVGAQCTNTSQQLVVTVLPTNATNPAFVFSVTNHGSVTLNGNGLLTAVKAGVDTVSVKSVADTTKHASVVVVVTNTSCVPVTGISIVLIPDHGSGNKGTTGQVTAKVTAPIGVDTSVIWYSTDPSVIEVAQMDGASITYKGQVILANVKGGTLWFAYPGTVQICAQMVVDPTVRACGTWTTN